MRPNSSEIIMELRERIIERAGEFFFNQGIKSVTMSDIAQDLGISKRTLYEVFPNKEELLESVVNKYMDKADADMSVILSKSKNVIDTLLRMYAKQLSEMHNTSKSLMFDLKKYHPNVYKRIHERHKRDIDVFIPLFQKGIEQGLIRDDINIQILIWLLGSQFKRLMESDWSGAKYFSMEEFVKAIILTFSRGIATAKGIEVIDEAIKKIEEEQKRNMLENI